MSTHFKLQIYISLNISCNTYRLHELFKKLKLYDETKKTHTKLLRMIETIAFSLHIWQNQIK